jgi:hypothetical protein
LKPPTPTASKFFLGDGFERHYEAAAKQTGVKVLESESFGEFRGAGGSAVRAGKVEFCAKPEQADESMRVLHAEITKRLREDGAEPSGEPPGQGEVGEWTIAYTSGALEGTVKATRSEPGVGPCDGAGVYVYKVNFRVTESRKK